MSPKDIDLFKHADKIRKAFAAEHEVIILEGRKFKIKRLDKNVTFYTGKDKDEVHHQVESWLIVSPARGRFPMAHIELENQGNLRTGQAR